MMKVMSLLPFDIRHSSFDIRYSFLVPARPGCGQAIMMTGKEENK